MATAGEALRVLLPVTVGFALVAIAAVVLRRGRGHRYNLYFAGLYLLSGLKSMGEGLTAGWEVPGHATVADRFHDAAPLFPGAGAWLLAAAVCALLMVPLLLLFVSSFPRPLAWAGRPATAALAFLPSAAIGYLLFLGPRTPSGVALTLGAFNLLATAVTVLAVVLLLRSRRSVAATERRQALYVLAGLLPSFLATWALSAAPFLLGDPQRAALERLVLFYVSPALELVAAAVVGYAILRFSLLGIEPKVKLGVRSLVFGAILAAIFLFTQFVENVVLQGQLFAFAGDYGSFILSGVAGIVLFKPIEKVSRKASDRLFPDTLKPEEQYHRERALEIYEAQATYVLRDAKVTDREMAFLRNLRAQLGLSEAQAQAVEERVERLLGVDSARTGQGEAPEAPASAAPPPSEVSPPPAPPAPSAGGESGPKAP